MPAANPVDATVFDLKIDSASNPVAGAEVIYTVPANARVEVLYAEVLFTALVAVANRYVFVKAERNTIEYVQTACTIAQILGDSFSYHFVAGLPEEVDARHSNRILVPLNAPLILEPADTLRIDAFNLGANDTFVNCRVRFKQWIIA